MKISVVIPVFNGEKFLKQAVNSVLNQTRKVDEIIIVDDGSTDKTKEILEDIHLNIDTTIKIIHHDQNKGIGATINTGIKNLSGDIFCWLSCDDLWLPTKIEEQVKLYEQHPNSVIYTDWCFIDSNGEKLKDYICPRVSQEEFRMKTLQWCNVNFSTIFIPKEVLDKVGLFEEHWRFGEDYNWLLRAVKLRIPFYLVENVLVQYRTHEGMLTKKVGHLSREQDKQMRKLLGLE